MSAGERWADYEAKFLRHFPLRLSLPRYSLSDCIYNGCVLVFRCSEKCDDTVYRCYYSLFRAEA